MRTEGRVFPVMVVRDADAAFIGGGGDGHDVEAVLHALERFMAPDAFHGRPGVAIEEFCLFCGISFRHNGDVDLLATVSSLMEDTVKVGRFTIKDSRFAITEEIWHYCLLPVWVLTFRGRGGELFYYALNGQTGDVAGKLPVDQRKLWTHAGILGLVVLIIGLIAGYLI